MTHAHPVHVKFIKTQYCAAMGEPCGYQVDGAETCPPVHLFPSAAASPGGSRKGTRGTGEEISQVISRRCGARGSGSRQRSAAIARRRAAAQATVSTATRAPGRWRASWQSGGRMQPQRASDVARAARAAATFRCRCGPGTARGLRDATRADSRTTWRAFGQAARSVRRREAATAWRRGPRRKGGGGKQRSLFYNFT